MKSGRGGRRVGAGRPSNWNNSKTVVIRIPEHFVPQILEIVRLLDNGGRVKVSAIKTGAVDRFHADEQLFLDFDERGDRNEEII